MTDQQKIETLRAALADLLRQTAGKIDQVHPAFLDARDKAARAYQMTE